MNLSNIILNEGLKHVDVAWDPLHSSKTEVQQKLKYKYNITEIQRRQTICVNVTNYNKRKRRKWQIWFFVIDCVCRYVLLLKVANSLIMRRCCGLKNIPNPIFESRHLSN